MLSPQDSDRTAGPACAPFGKAAGYRDSPKGRSPRTIRLRRTQFDQYFAALGFTIGREMGQPTGDAIAAVGDGAITAGMAYEAMNASRSSWQASVRNHERQ